jgi:polysaccharide biosynthesis transport protein
MSGYRSLESESPAGEQSEADIQPNGEPGFGLNDFMRIVRVRLKIILGAAAIVVALAALMLLHATPLYTANALAMLDSRQNRIEDENAALTQLVTSPSAVQNQTYILQSRSLMSRVVDKLHLLDAGKNDEAVKPSLLAYAIYYVNPLHWLPRPVSTKSPEEKLQDQRNYAIDFLLAGEDVRPLGLSSAISITFTSEDPNTAAEICNAIADAYVEDQLAAKFEAAQKATAWLSDRIGELAIQVQEAEAAVQEYKAENNLTATANGTPLVNQQMEDINSQLAIARSDLAEKEARYTRVIQLQKSGHAEDISQVVQSPLITQLRTQETELLRQEADLTSKYGPRHPKILDLQSQKRNLEAKIAEEVQRVVQTVANDVAVARSRAGSLQASISNLSGLSSVDSKARVHLTELEAKATSSRQLYEAFLERFKQSQGQEGIQSPDARIISRAVVPESPSSPHIFMSLVLAVPGGLMLGLVLAFLIEHLDTGFRTVSQIERLLGLPVLSTIPEVRFPDKTGSHAVDLVVDKPMSSFTEAMRGLQMGLLLSNVDRKPKVVLVTSAMPDEGKTTLAISLARLAAQGQKKTILIDADLRRPSVAESIGLSAEEANLVQFLAGEASLEKSLLRDPHSPVTVLGASKVVGSPSDLLGSATIAKLIDSLKASYDFIVIDSSPLLPVNDTKAIAGLADAILLAVRWEKTPRDAVVEAVRALTDIHAPLVGVALTRADAERYRYYSYGYQNYHSYNKYYGE